MPSAGYAMQDRRARLTLAVPVSTPGDYSSTTLDVITISGADDPDVPGLRFSWKVTKTLTKHPNVAEIVATNLNPNSRAKIQSKGTQVLLEAGYKDGGLARIFLGDTRTADHVRDKADWNTTLKCGDGDRAFRWSRCNESFEGGTPAATVIRYLAGQLGIPVGNLPQQIADFSVRFDHGYVVHGATKNAIHRLCTSLGLTWSIQDKALQILQPGVAIVTEVPLISPDTGLIGSPEMGTPEKKGKPALCKFRSLLLPVSPGSLVYLKSERYDGRLLVKRVEHIGDIRGSDWYSDIQGVVYGS